MFRHYLLGDPGFAISEFVIPTFDHRGTMGPQHRSFNRRHSRARDVVERMFGVVKGRWRLLRKPMDILSVNFAIILICACFLLHNFCLRGGVACPARWVEEYHAEQHNNNQQPNDDDGEAADNGITASSRALGIQMRQRLLQLHQLHPQP